MQQKTALITGANAGMGKATAVALASAGMRVVMLCRNAARGEAALADVRAQSGSDAVSLMRCDLGDMADIRRFCAGFRAAHARLDILVLNAGVLLLRREETTDGLERHFGVSHIGHFLLTNLLLNLMPASADARIIVVGSVAHKIGRISFDDLPMRRGYNVAAAYGRAKLCNLLFTRELARRVADRGIAVNCAHPGAVASDIVISRTTGLGKTLTRALGWIALTPEQGAQTAIHLATSPDVQGVTGEYFYRKRIAKSSPRSRDMALAQRLWAVSEEIAGL